MHHKKIRTAVIALIIANIIWGAAAPIYKWALTDIHPFALAFLRFFLGSLILLPLVHDKLDIGKNDWLKLLFLSIIGITINIGFFTVGLQFALSINAPIISSAGPVFLIMGSVFFLHERLRPKVTLGTVISFLGILVIIIRPMFEHGLHGSIVGNLFLVIATLANVLYTILLKKFIVKYDPITVTFWSFLIGAISFLPMFYLETQTVGTSLMTHKAIIGVLYAALGSSVIAYCLYTFALKYLVTSEVGVFVYLDPIVTALVAVPLLGETITATYLFGSVLVFLGIFIAEGRIHYHPLHKLRG
jgi:drug/metabolite transporter (DMT)-like permease